MEPPKRQGKEAGDPDVEGIGRKEGGDGWFSLQATVIWYIIAEIYSPERAWRRFV